MALGALVVSLGLNASDFISGLSKSEQQAKKFGDSLDRNIAAGVIKAQIALEALGAAARTSLEVFKSLTTGAGQFKDLEETTGAAAESIASLAVSAAVAGVDINDVAGAANKLTKNLVGVDDESKAAGAALAALNLNIEDFKKLDPVGQYEAVGRALAGFADGASKTAVAQALFGKSGAEQLKVFKALEEAGGRQNILTQRQIELADAYADAQSKAGAQLRLYAQAAASEALPALSALTKATTELIKGLLSVDSTTSQIGANTAIRDFAYDAAAGVAVLLESMAALVKTARAVGGSFQVVAADIALPFKIAAAAGGSDGSGLAARLSGIGEALKQRNAVVAEANQRYVDLWNYDGTRISDAIRKAQRQERMGLTGERLNATTDPRSLTFGKAAPALNFSGAVKAAGGVKSASGGASEAERYLEALQRQLQGTQDLTVAEKVLADIQSGRLTLSGKITQDALLGVAVQIDAAKAFEQSMKEGQAQAGEFLKEREKERKAIEDLQKADEDRLQGLLKNTAGEVFKSQQADIEFLRQAFLDGRIVAEQYGEAVAIVMGSVKNEIKDVNEFSAQAARNIQDALGSTLELALSGKFSSIGDLWAQTIQRMVAQAAAAQLNKAMFGESFGKDGELGGFIGAGINAISAYYGGGKAGGGSTMPNSIYRVSENRPEVYSDGSGSWLITGSQRGNVDPNPKMGGGRTINAPIYITVPGNTDRRTAGQIGAEVSRALGVASVRNN